MRTELITLFDSQFYELAKFDIVIGRNDPAPLVFLYKGKTYARVGAYEYRETTPVSLHDPKLSKPRPAELDSETIDRIVQTAKKAGFAVKFRNRNGKQYLNLAWTYSTLNKDWWDNFAGSYLGTDGGRYDRVFVKQFAATAVHTSGSYGPTSGDHTYRLNP